MKIEHRQPRLISKLLPDPRQCARPLIAASKTGAVENQDRIRAVELLAVDLGSRGAIVEGVVYYKLPGGDRQFLISRGNRETLHDIRRSVRPPHSRNGHLGSPDSCAG